MLEGTNPDAPMTPPLADIAVVALDQVNWRAPLLAYLLEVVLPPEGLKHDRSLNAPRHSSHLVMNFTCKVRQEYS